VASGTEYGAVVSTPSQLTRASRSLLSREAQLLVLTAGDPTNEARLRRLLATDLNWHELGSLAQHERATSVLWQWLLRVGTDRVPRAVETAWRQLAMASEFQLLQLEGLLHDTVRTLATAGIDVMLLKGSALAYTIYGSFADRPMGDLDLLIRPHQAHEAWRLLQTNGWKWPSARWPAERYQQYQHLPPLVDAQGRDFRLEVHTDLFRGGHPFRLSAEALWRTANPVRLNGQTVFFPNPQQQLLHVCIHFAWSHAMQWGSWRTFRDVGALTRHGAIHWTSLVDIALASRAATCCFWTLRLARNLTGAHVPEDVLHALRPPRPAFLLDRLERHYALQLFPTERGCPSVMLGNRLWELGMAPRWSEHGSVRPWDAADNWLDAADDPPRPTPWPRQLLNHVRHVGLSVGYLGRITAPPGHPAAR
jgi:hypothetical protein